MVQAFTILFMFIVLLTAITSYLFYYYRYEKLARYFLSNMYRFKSSYVLMTITFGLRPFLKGLVHAKFFDNWNLQIWLLIGIELAMIIIIILFEVGLDNHKSRLILFLELLYSFCLIGLNVLLLCKHQYFDEEDETQFELELYIKLIVYFMIILIVLRFLAEIKDAIECKCGSRVVPADKV